jgi:hypothetical protein
MGWRYKKFTVLLFSFVLAYLIVSNKYLENFFLYFSGLDYLGAFFVGMGYAYGFTAAPATAILILMDKALNPFILAAIAGIGALIADILILQFVRHSFQDEIDYLKKEKFMLYLKKLVPSKIIYYLVPFFGWLIIASPLPDEIGVVLLSTEEKINEKEFIFVSWLINSIGLLLILILAR